MMKVPKNVFYRSRIYGKKNLRCKNFFFFIILFEVFKFELKWTAF